MASKPGSLRANGGVGQVEDCREPELDREKVPRHELVNPQTCSFGASDELANRGLRVQRKGRRGWIRSDWGPSEWNRRARYYSPTIALLFHYDRPARGDGLAPRDLEPQVQRVFARVQLRQLELERADRKSVV